MVAVERERLREIFSFIIQIFNHGSLGPGLPPMLGEGKFAMLLGVNLLAANEIAEKYASGDAWFDCWLNAKLKEADDA